jgi:hypothetical protein
MSYRIKRLVIQLFFKINQQHKWKGSHKVQAGRAAETTAIPTLQESNPIASAANPASSPSTPIEPRPRSSAHSPDPNICIGSGQRDIDAKVSFDIKFPVSGTDDPFNSSPSPSLM